MREWISFTDRRLENIQNDEIAALTARIGELEGALTKIANHEIPIQNVYGYAEAWSQLKEIAKEVLK